MGYGLGGSYGSHFPLILLLLILLLFLGDGFYYSGNPK